MGPLFGATIFYSNGREVKYVDLTCHPHVKEGYWMFDFKDSHIRISPKEIVSLYSYTQKETK